MVNKIEKKINPLTFVKYLAGIGPSNLTIKAKKTEREIKKTSKIKKKNSLSALLFLIKNS